MRHIHVSLLQCFRQQRYQLCAEKHTTFSHKCIIKSCKVKEEKCQYIQLKCANCFEAHEANSTECILNERVNAEAILRKMSSNSNTKSAKANAETMNEDIIMNENSEWESFETTSQKRKLSPQKEKKIVINSQHKRQLSKRLVLRNVIIPKLITHE